MFPHPSLIGGNEVGSAFKIQSNLNVNDDDILSTPLLKKHNSWMELNHGKVPMKRTLSGYRF